MSEEGSTVGAALRERTGTLQFLAEFAQAVALREGFMQQLLLRPLILTFVCWCTAHLVCFVKRTFAEKLIDTSGTYSKKVDGIGRHRGLQICLTWRSCHSSCTSLVELCPTSHHFAWSMQGFSHFLLVVVLCLPGKVCSVVKTWEVAIAVQWRRPNIKTVAALTVSSESF